MFTYLSDKNVVTIGSEEPTKNKMTTANLYMSQTAKQNKSLLCVS